MITQTKRTQRGFSLNESMISLTLLSSGLLALAQFQGQAQQNSGHTKTQTTAVNLAQQKLETLRDQASTDYAGIVSNSDSPLTHTGDNTGFSRHWTVTPHTSPNYKEVSVTTDWQSTDGAARSVTISSFLAPSTPYTAGHGAGSTSNGEAAEDDAFPGQEVDVQGDGGMEADSARNATCLCTRRGATEQAQLDARSSDPSCTDTCCQTIWEYNPEGACQSDDCEFVAQCWAG